MIRHPVGDDAGPPDQSRATRRWIWGGLHGPSCAKRNGKKRGREPIRFSVREALCVVLPVFAGQPFAGSPRRLLAPRRGWCQAGDCASSEFPPPALHHQRRSLAVLRMSASAYRYAPRRDRNIALRARILALAQRHTRYGVGMIHRKLRQAGMLVNDERVERLDQDAKL